MVGVDVGEKEDLSVWCRVRQRRRRGGGGGKAWQKPRWFGRGRRRGEAIDSDLGKLDKVAI